MIGTVGLYSRILRRSSDTITRKKGNLDDFALY